MSEKFVKLSYLFERVYDVGTNNDIEQDTKEEADFWKKLFGEDFYERVLLNKKNIKHYFEKQPIQQLYLPDYIQNSIWFSKQKSQIQCLDIYTSDNFLSEWVNWTVSELHWCNRQYFLNREFYLQVARDLEARLECVYIRVLIAEMHILLEEQKIFGKDPFEKYQYFVREYIRKQKYTYKIMRLYPGLYRAVINELHQFYKFYQEFIKCYFAFEIQIREYFSINEKSSILRVSGGISDMHNHGKSVLIIEFTKGERLVYKPRTGANEITFYYMLNYLYRQCGLTEKEYKVLDQTGCCWCEYLQLEECRDKRQLKNYYKRIGILLFTAGIFGSGDLHEENLITCGEFPMAVDLEVLTKQNIYIASPLEWKIQSSVMYTGILPVCYWGRHGKGILIGALGDKGSVRRLPFQMPYVANNKSTDMRIVYKNQFDVGRVCGNGTGADFYSYKNEIMEGYQAAYNYALQAKEEMWEMLSNMVGNIRNRILYEDTLKYTMLIQSSFHPDLMLDAADREIYLEKIRERQNIKKEGVIQEEILAMLRRDIPLFYQNANEKAVRSDGKLVDEASELESPLATIHKNIFALSISDRNWQTYQIQLSMDLYKMNTQDMINIKMEKKNIQTSTADGRMNENAYIQKICEKIEHMLICIEGDIGWIEPTIIEDHWIIQVNNDYFYSGTAGMFFLYHCLMLSGKIEKDSKILHALEEKMQRHTIQNRDQLQSDRQKKTGIFEGEFSIVYAYLLVYRLTGDSKYLQLAKEHADTVQHYVEVCSYYDLLEGKAGSVMGNLLLYEVTREQRYLDNAEETARQIADAGIAWMFSKVYFHTKNDWYQLMAAEAVRYENANYDTEKNDWKDFRYMHHTQDGLISWCHGAGGILLSRKNIMQNCTDQELISVCREDIAKNIGRIMDNKMRKGMCMCHGTAGNYEIVRACMGTAAETLRMGDIEEMLLQERITPGFMSGLGGICYGYLRELHPELPNILNFEI